MVEAHELVEGSSGVVFDLFHTLCAIEIAMPRVPPESWQIMGLAESAWVREWLALAPARTSGQIRDVGRAMAEAARRADPNVASDIIRAAILSREEKFRQALIHIEAEVLHVLSSLRQQGKRLALLSNADAMEVAAWPDSPLCELFDAAVISCAVGLLKPDPEAYRYTCREMGVLPQYCVFVGDGGSDELAGAKRVGMRAVQMTGIVQRIWPETIAERSRDADCQITALAELLPPP